MKNQVRQLLSAFLFLAFAGAAFAQTPLVTANRVYHHVSGRKYQVIYGSRVLDSHRTDASLFAFNDPDADLASIQLRVQEALDFWLGLYANDGFLVPGRDDAKIAQYRSRSGLDQHADFMLVYELTGPDFTRRELLGFWGTGGTETMEKSFGLCLHRRKVCMAQLNAAFFPFHWRTNPGRFVGKPFFIWDGGQALEIGPVWASRQHPWVFSHMLHSGHWDAGMTTTQQAIGGGPAPFWGPSLVMPSDFVNWSAPRQGRPSRARLFRERLQHEPLLIDGESTVYWGDTPVELSTIHVTTYLHELAAQLRHEAFLDFLYNTIPGPLHLGMDPWVHRPEGSDWARPNVVRTALDQVTEDGVPCHRALVTSNVLIESLHTGPGGAAYRAQEHVVHADGSRTFRPLHGTRVRGN